MLQTGCIQPPNTMKLTLNNISHFDFFASLEKTVAEIETKLESNDLGIADLANFTNEKIASVKGYLSRHVKPNADGILDLLEDWYTGIDDYAFYPKYGVGKEPDIRTEIEHLERFFRSLKLAIKYLSTVDTLIDKDHENSIENILDKSDFILNKLNGLFDDNNYSISRIFALNGIPYSAREPREIAEDLYSRGYVILESRYGESDYVQISVKGASYIERKNKQKRNARTKDGFDKKLDGIIEHLTKLGYGQEIIFNEIDELRELQRKLSKKNWSQLLKGKLIDLTVGKLISAETASMIYEYLTNSSFKLLK